MNKYIRQQVLQDFVYPNSNVSQYDTELIHDVNNNVPAGSIDAFTFVSGTTTGITCSLSYTWDLNGAEPFRSTTNETNNTILSIHGLAPGQNYYKPWRNLLSFEDARLSGTATTLTRTFSNIKFGVDTLTTGTYYFEFRFIGRRAVKVINASLNITI